MLKVLDVLQSRNSSRRVEVAKESIEGLRRRFGAMVSSDDNYLTHGGGVSAALWQAAGPGVAPEVEAHRPKLTLGDVHVTRPGRLDCDFLLHAITIDLDGSR